MLMNLYVVCVVLMILLVCYSYFIGHYTVQYQKCKTDEELNHVLFFRTNESYSTSRDAKKMIKDKLEYGGEEILQNANKQEELNKSKRVRQFKKVQKKQERKKRFLRKIRLFHFRDLCTIFVYLVLPIICIVLLQRPAIYEYFKGIIAGVSNHRVDIYLSQLSLTFITISLMSIFSDTNAIVLWENIVKKTLIEPPASCFKAFFSYSFIYLFFGSLALVLRFDVGIGVLFVFNIICLFDLSRTMINCYYDPNRKKVKVIREFIDKIERANIQRLQRGEKKSDEYISEVKSTLEDFNYYISNAYDNGKYNDVREYLAVYGKLLAHLDSATIGADEIRVLEWYDSKTYKAYKDFVKGYYEECYAFVLGLSNTNSQPMNKSGLGFEMNIINHVLVRLANDIPNVHEVDDIYNLILFAFYTNLLNVARSVDIDHLEQYLIEVKNDYNVLILDNKKDELKRVIKRLMSVLYCEGTSNSLPTHLFEKSREMLVGNIILINSEDILLLDLDFVGWKKLKAKFGTNICEYIKEYIDMFSEERKKMCISRRDIVMKM